MIEAKDTLKAMVAVAQVFKDLYENESAGLVSVCSFPDKNGKLVPALAFLRTPFLALADSLGIHVVDGFYHDTPSCGKTKEFTYEGVRFYALAGEDE